MALLRVQLLRDDTRLPLDPGWHPTIEQRELEAANRNLRRCGLPFHFEPITEPS